MLEASVETLKQRLAGRARDDDHSVTIEKRMETWHQESSEVVEHYRSQGKLVEVNAEGEKEKVHKDMEKELANKVPVAGFFLLSRGRSRSAGEEDIKEGADGGDSTGGTRTVTPS